MDVSRAILAIIYRNVPTGLNGLVRQLLCRCAWDKRVPRTALGKTMGYVEDEAPFVKRG